MRFWLSILLTLFCFLNLSLNASSQIIEVCPNPYGDDGAEYIKALCYGNCILTDGEASFNFNGSITAAKDREIFNKTFDYYPDTEFPSRFALSNSGEEILLLKNGAVIDSFSYGKEGFNYMDDGVIYFRNGKEWDFRYQDWTSFQPVREKVSGRIIVSPCNYHIDAEEVVLIASYTVTDYTLARLKDDGVEIEVFIDASPVGGVPLEEFEALRNINTHFLKSSSFKNFHYKFAVIDGKKVIITTENWKWDKRGYIVEFESENVSTLLKNVLEHDIIYEGEGGNTGGIKGEGMHSAGKEINFESNIEVFILPDSNPVFDLISNASSRVYIQVPYIDFEWFEGTPLLDSILIAAKNGAEVRILLDGKYNKEKNQKTVEFINELGRERNLNIEAKIMRSLPLHGKTVISDDKGLITSANFNRYGFKLNREAGIIIHNKKVSDFLAEQFTEDWSGSGYNPVYIIPAIAILTISIAITFRLMKK